MQKNYATPTNQNNVLYSYQKSDDLKKSKIPQYPISSDFTSIEEENANLRTQVHILEEKIRFIDKEFQIKVSRNCKKFVKAIIPG